MGRHRTDKAITEAWDRHGTARGVAAELGISNHTACSYIRNVCGVKEMLRGRRTKKKIKEVDALAKRTAGDTQSDELWRSYWADRSQVNENAVFEHYRAWVVDVVRRHCARREIPIPPEQFIAAVYLRVARAIQLFDPKAGVKFTTYALTHITGAISDELRDSDDVPRLERSRMNRVEAMRRRLSHEEGHEPTDDELAEALGVTLSGVESPHESISMDKVVYESEYGRPIELADLIHDRGCSSEELIGRKQALRYIFQALGAEEATMLYLYHWRDSTMKNIGAAMGLSESRVSQVMSAVHARLRDNPRILTELRPIGCG